MAGPAAAGATPPAAPVAVPDLVGAHALGVAADVAQQAGPVHDAVLVPVRKAAQRGHDVRLGLLAGQQVVQLAALDDVVPAAHAASGGAGRRAGR
jgi:hypothetical protein